jgi:hypothetical protein
MITPEAPPTGGCHGHRLYQGIVAVPPSPGNPRTPALFDFPGGQVARVYHRAAARGRPASWARRRGGGPTRLRGRPSPSPAARSRRLRPASAAALLDALQRRVTAPKGPGLPWMTDARRRVRRWARAKLALARLKADAEITTRAA